MRSTSHLLPLIASVVGAAILAACGDKDFVNEVPPANALVTAHDDCDSVSFNAALGAGTCMRAGGVTFSQFNTELTASQRVAAWQFVPSTLTVRVGQAVNALNQGGEVHTFTEVENFGGGIVPALNTASGNTIVAPECMALSNADNIAPGATFTTDAATEVGTEHYQCCIHPWMRATVTVTP